ncbi:beta-1,3-galactosyltransferase 5-like [Dermacentor andersoni]|uniref:beta-1,3-galactosyltransferase 5-like n=1 Tax=Dermacentor andersoni TaxID=34620 RepID=UPI002416ECDC|nr:beta-1,3-galactosyltransferase 5-like [Dermacentor andersoni]
MASRMFSWIEFRRPKCAKILNRTIACALIVSLACLMLLPTTYRGASLGYLREAVATGSPNNVKPSTDEPASAEPMSEESAPVEPNASRSFSVQVTSVKPVQVANSSYGAIAENATSTPGWKVLNACGTALRVLYYVHTAPDHFDRRRLLRSTIGNPAVAAFLNSSVVFFVGQTTDAELSAEVRAEAACEGDVVLLEHVDTYRNLTYKFIGATKWLTANGCLGPSTDVVVKLDDDVIVNVFLLASYVKRHLAAGTRDSRRVHCATMPVLKPIREKKFKWFVTKEEYANDTYPPYCCGAAYLMRASVLALLVEATSSVPFFWVDDVYATGLLTRAANVSLVDIRKKYVIFTSKNTTAVSNSTLFLHWGMTPTLFTRTYRFWANVLGQNRTE